MKPINDPVHATTDPHTPHLLSVINRVRAGVGDGLNDTEFTGLLWQMVLPTEAGFGFLSYCDGAVTLTVPPQEFEDWYAESGWIKAAKEQAAREIAKRYDLSLSEPPDESTSPLLARSESAFHHHLELTNPWQTVIVAHPTYLKVRLLGVTSAIQYARRDRSPLPLSPNLLQDLSALY